VTTDAALLAAAVQANCDLTDALHAREKSLCTYLLGMREYFRWSERLPLAESPGRGALSEWIARRERDWDRLRDSDAGFVPLPLAGGIAPFDESTVNRALEASGLVYGAGLGLFGAPMFFLAQRAHDASHDGARVIVAGTELARGITAAPATSRGAIVVIRRDALCRWLWTRAESALRGPADSAFALALRAYGGADVQAAVEAMADGEAGTLVLHELGELRAAERLGPDWEQMLLASDRRTEVVLRAVRDLLADCLITLPRLAADAADRSLLFWFASFDGLRRALAPGLAEAFGTLERIDRAALLRAANAGSRLWQDRASELLEHWRRGGVAAVQGEAARLAGTH
jgi:hypothetical protein